MASPRALALAVLAAEECGKAIHAFGVLNSGGDPNEVDSFERNYRHHDAKLASVEVWRALLDEKTAIGPGLNDQVRVEARSVSGRKMDAFYVDRGTDGRAVTPRSTISAQEIDEAIESAQVLETEVSLVAALLAHPGALEQFWLIGPKVANALPEGYAEDPELIGALVAGLRETVIPALGLTGEMIGHREA